MFYSIKGSVANLNDLEICHLVSLECASGLGFNLKVSNFTAEHCSKMGQEIKLFTHLIVRENTFELFGFFNVDELEIFKMLVSVSGVGPNFAITILSTLKIEEIVSFIICGNEKALCSCKGIGEKTASRIILELKNKLKNSKFNNIENSSKNSLLNKNFDEAVSALMVLGFDKSKILSAVKAQPVNYSVQQLIKNALKILR